MRRIKAWLWQWWPWVSKAKFKFLSDAFVLSCSKVVALRAERDHLRAKLAEIESKQSS